MSTEADTCRKYVLPNLIQVGWDNEPHSFTEQKTFTDGRIVIVGNRVRRRAQKRADYLRSYRPISSFLIEAAQQGRSGIMNIRSLKAKSNTPRPSPFSMKSLRPVLPGGTSAKKMTRHGRCLSPASWPKAATWILKIREASRTSNTCRPSNWWRILSKRNGVFWRSWTRLNEC